MVRRATRRQSSANPHPQAIAQLPYQSVQNHLVPLAPLSLEQLQEIDEKSKQLLAVHGIEVMCPKARALYRDAGAEVDEASEIVRLDGALLESLLETTPAQFTLHSYNKARQITVGGSHINFGMVSGPPNVHDCISGRRAGNFADYQNFIKLGQSFNCIHFFGNQTLSPSDLPVNTRHLDTNLVNFKLTDKPFSVSYTHLTLPTTPYV